MTPKSRTLRLASSIAGRPWDNLKLFEELLHRGSGREDSGHWAIWHWQGAKTPPPLLSIIVHIPSQSTGTQAAQDFVGAVADQLERALSAFSDERGWPKPRFLLRTDDSGRAEGSYQISLAGGDSVGGPLQPANLLVIGEPLQLRPLLGLETVDPVLGLPAKWIGRSQLDIALAGELHVFDGPGLIATHTLHFLSNLCHQTVGFLEIQGWLAPALSTHGEQVAQLLGSHSGLLLHALTALMAEGLWLPHPSRFCELFVLTLAEFEDGTAANPSLFKERLRQEIVPLNLGRFRDQHGILHAVEWRGDPSTDNSTQNRLMTRLGHAVSQLQEEMQDGAPVLVTDFENRPVLGEVLAGPFPQLPVLSWAELPSHTRLELRAVVDAAFDVDPSAWTCQTFEVPYSLLVEQDP